jgi:hypothetical protein
VKLAKKPIAAGSCPNAGLCVKTNAGVNAKGCGNLMPNVIRAVVPLVIQPMIDYLRVKTGTPGGPDQASNPDSKTA